MEIGRQKTSFYCNRLIHYSWFYNGETPINIVISSWVVRRHIDQAVTSCPSDLDKTAFVGYLYMSYIHVLGFQSYIFRKAAEL